MRHYNLLLTGGVLLLSGCQLTPYDHSTTENETDFNQVLIAETPSLPDSVTVEHSQVEVKDLWQRLQDGMQWESPNEDYIAPYRNRLLEDPRHLELVFNRAEPFLYHIVEELDSRGLPLELALLPAIESAFDPQAISHASASGLWQFTPPIARYFGLKMNWWYDGRNDVRASTKAAADFLEYLYDRTGQNWHYAIAAYNSGEGRVLSAVKHNERLGKPVDIWALQLPKETRNYVPNLLALADVIKHADQYELTLPTLKNEAVLDVVDIGSQIEIELAAEMAGLDINELKALNPGFRQWATAPKGPHKILLPSDKVENFVVALAQTPVENRVSWQRYKINRGDSLSVIAHRFGTTPQVLKQMNQMKDNRLIAGKELIVPAGADNSSQANAARQQPALHYRVKSGDSLWKIANNHGITIDELRQWNKLDSHAVIKKGQLLTVWPDAVSDKKSMTYSVRRGDSLSVIAKKFNVKITELMSWNQLTSSAIRPGQTLEIKIANQSVGS